MKPNMISALALTLSVLTWPATGQDLPKDISFAGPDGTIVEGVRCATIDTAPPEGWAHDTPPLDGTVYVPIAFHVITSVSGVGSLTDQQLQRQVDTLNTSFDESGFQFFINSIDRTANDTWFYSTSSNDGSMKAALAIDPAHNLNLYTANIGGGILGYAYLPWQFPESNTLHGVVVLYSSLPGGSAFPYNLGATATHEVGHYLGLYHTFEGGCSGNGDFVDDTPAEASPAFGCPVGRNTCTSPGVDPIHNYMDYTDDICMFEFTPGQAERMDWAVTTYKPGLLEASVAPNPPGNVVAYSDYSTPTSVALSWSDPTSLNTGDTLLVDYFHVHVYRDGALVDSVAGGTEQYLDSGLLEGNEYEYELFAKLDSSAFPGTSVIVTATAGGSRIPGTPESFSLSGDLDQVTLSWTNPSTNIDNSTMIDFAGIRLYQNDVLVMTYVRSPSDTGNVETEDFTPSVPGAYAWYLTAIDNEIPQNESPPTETQITPLNLPALDAFNTAGLPNSGMWTTTNGDVNDRADNPPSPRY
ncbi:MAG: M43 family zinc metalloprotease, partial [Ignavibacteria bacterium]|nr:M43 family zinc metalloprotease [Ignavibacteria bacterium]